jgi:Na+-transporting NADH:ubiquinone oxidoreductase subunit NqrD
MKTLKRITGYSILILVALLFIYLLITTIYDGGWYFLGGLFLVFLIIGLVFWALHLIDSN